MDAGALHAMVNRGKTGSGPWAKSARHRRSKSPVSGLIALGRHPDCGQRPELWQPVVSWPPERNHFAQGPPTGQPRHPEFDTAYAVHTGLEPAQCFHLIHGFDDGGRTRYTQIIILLLYRMSYINKRF